MNANNPILWIAVAVFVLVQMLVIWRFLRLPDTVRGEAWRHSRPMVLLTGVTAAAVLLTAGLTSLPFVEANRPLMIGVGLVAGAVVVMTAVRAVRMERALARRDGARSDG